MPLPIRAPTYEELNYVLEKTPTPLKPIIRPIIRRAKDYIDPYGLKGPESDNRLYSTDDEDTDPDDPAVLKFLDVVDGSKYIFPEERKKVRVSIGSMERVEREMGEAMYNDAFKPLWPLEDKKRIESGTALVNSHGSLESLDTDIEESTLVLVEYTEEEKAHRARIYVEWNAKKERTTVDEEQIKKDNEKIDDHGMFSPTLQPRNIEGKLTKGVEDRRGKDRGRGS